MKTKKKNAYIYTSLKVNTTKHKTKIFYEEEFDEYDEIEEEEEQIDQKTKFYISSHKMPTNERYDIPRYKFLLNKYFKVKIF